MQSSDSTRRGFRTFLDSAITVLVSLTAVLAIPGINDQFEKLGLGQALSLFALFVVIFLTFFTKLKNALEDKGTIPALFKAPASEGVNPVPDADDEEYPENPYDDPEFDGRQDVL